MATRKKKLPIPPPAPPLKTWIVERVGGKTLKVQGRHCMIDSGALRFVGDEDDTYNYLTLKVFAPKTWVDCELIEG